MGGIRILTLGSVLIPSNKQHGRPWQPLHVSVLKLDHATHEANQLISGIGILNLGFRKPWDALHAASADGILVHGARSEATCDMKLREWGTVL